jgi:predicted N-acetyltransferase YhbS
MHIMRDAEAFIPELSFVAIADNTIVGNIAYMRSSITTDQGNMHPVITFGPISVLPDCQGHGIGSLLINHTKKLALDKGFRAILIYGDPNYYSRFGFVAAEKYGIKTSGGQFAAALQACELYRGALDGLSGRFVEDSVYELDEDKAAEFEKTFPYKEKLVTPSQARFIELIHMCHSE